MIAEPVAHSHSLVAQAKTVDELIEFLETGSGPTLVEVSRAWIVAVLSSLWTHTASFMDTPGSQRPPDGHESYG